MPEAIITTLAKAVTTALNEPPDEIVFSKEFVAERVHLPEYDTAKVKSLKVFVIGSGIGVNLEEGNRSTNSETYTILIGFYNTIKRTAGKPDMVEVDAMDYLVEQVRKYFAGMTQFDDITTLYLASVKNDVPFDPATLHEKDVYVSVISLTYQAYF